MPHIHTNPGEKDFTVDVCVVRKRGNKDVEVLLRVHDKYKKWLLPGGHVEPNETPPEAAIREVKEELGLDVILFGSSYWDDPISGYVHIRPPEYMNIHPITELHSHISCVYFAFAGQQEIVESESEKSGGLCWCTLNELLATDWEIDRAIRYYAEGALRCAREKLALYELLRGIPEM